MRRPLGLLVIVIALAGIALGGIYLRAGGDEGAGTANSGTQPTTGQTSPAGDAPAPDEASPWVVVYYFHRTLRCPACLTIEQYAREAVHESFPGESADGSIAWRAVDFEQSEHRHFEREFNLEVQSLILAEYDGRRCVRWKLLPDVWDLVDDQWAFTEYVQTELTEFLGG